MVYVWLFKPDLKPHSDAFRRPCNKVLTFNLLSGNSYYIPEGLEVIR